MWSGGEHAEIRITDARAPFNAMAILPPVHERSVTVLCSIPGASLVISGAVDRSIVMWNSQKMIPIRTFVGQAQRLHSRDQRREGGSQTMYYSLEHGER